MIIGTAGHVDHGKTRLVRALTGVDTDRLPEEKARGISIALGYAYVALDNGDVLGYVDVPGHERFLPAMLSGATGIDFALLVVAADDGVMPQTREHLDILSLLGIGTGAVALTKVDCVAPERVTAVQRQLVALLADTPLAGSPVFALSATRGDGVAALREHLQALAQALTVRNPRAQGHFRLAVDRSFSLPGVGTVVTGTIHGGRVAVGDIVTLAPGGTPARVRGIHAQDRPSQTGVAGQRCALNLAGVERSAVQRGDWVTAPGAVLSTQRVDARVALLPHAAHGIRSGSAVHVHAGTTHAPARLVVLAGGTAMPDSAGELQPGQGGLVQLVLQHPLALWHGDRLIVRDAAGALTLGGGCVLDPFAPARYRRTPERLAELAALELADPQERCAQLLAQAPLGIDLARYTRAGSIALAANLPAAQRLRTGEADYAVGLTHWRNLQDQLLAVLAQFHRDHPDAAGPDRSRLQRMASPRLPPAIFAALLGDLHAAGRVVAVGYWLHLPGHVQVVSAADQAVLQQLLPRLAAAPFDPPWVRDLAGTEALGEAQVRGVLTRAAQRGEVFPVVRDLYYHPNAIRDLAAIARRVQAQDGAVRAAAFRDQTGLGRKRAIQLLEYFDQIGLLRRLHDRHLLRPDHPLAAAAMDNRGAAAAAGAAAQNPPSRDSAQDLR